MINNWKEFFIEEKKKAYYIALHNKVMEEYKTKIVYPPYNLILSMSTSCALSEISSSVWLFLIHSNVILSKSFKVSLKPARII